MAFCSPDEQKIVDRDALVVDIAGGMFSSGVAFIPGVGIPMAAIVSAGKSAVAENIRDTCRSENERQGTATTIKGVLSEGLGIVSNAVIPGSGIAKELLEGAANTASNLATDRAVDQVMNADYVTSPETQGPTSLFPEHKPALSEHQKSMMRSASEALRGAVIEAGSENIGHGVSANAKGKAPDVSSGLY